MKIILGYLAFGLVSASGCECVPGSIEQAKRSSEVIFRGTITAIREGKIVFRVARVWKGDVGTIFNMPEFTESAACLGFRENLLHMGNDLIVFATRLHRYPKDNDYFTNICLPTSLVKDGDETLKILGKGRSPAP